MKNKPVPDILHFSVEAFKELSPEELILLLYVTYFPGDDQRSITKGLGVGMRKTAALLRSLKGKGYINYRPGDPQSARSSGYIFQDEIGSIPKWVLLSPDLKGLSKEKAIYAYLHTFMNQDRIVLKKRSEIEKILKIKKSTVKHSIGQLEGLGFLTKHRGQKNLIVFNLFERQKVSFLKSLFGG